MHQLTVEQITVMLLLLGVLIGTARLFGEIARHFRQPVILGELIAGVALGPTLLGVLWSADTAKSSVIAVGLSKAGIDFHAPDGRLAHVVLMLLPPEENATAQLDLSAAIARKFRDPQVAGVLVQVTNYTEFLAMLKMIDRR